MWLTKNTHLTLNWQGKENAKNGSYFFDFIPLGFSILHFAKETSVYIYLLFWCLAVLKEDHS